RRPPPAILTACLVLYALPVAIRLVYVRFVLSLNVGKSMLASLAQQLSLRRRSFLAVFAAGLLLGWTSDAFAYRPFDGTDAAVADPGEVEIELQPAGAQWSR